MRAKLARRLNEMSGHLYRDRFHLINTLTMAVDDCGLRLGTVDMGTEDSDRRVVGVCGSSGPIGHIIITWTTTDHGNLEANLDFI